MTQPTPGSLAWFEVPYLRDPSGNHFGVFTPPAA